MSQSIHSNNLIGRAYQLWNDANPNENLKRSQEKIIHQLFMEMKQQNPWFSWFYTIVEHLFPIWVTKKVEKALSACKFDWLLAGRENDKLNFLSVKERWFIDQKMTKIFKNIICKSQPLTLEGKARRWKQKIEKYYDKQEFMIGSYILYQVGEKFPNLRRSIDWMKVLRMSYIEKHSKETLQNVDDDAIVRGLTHYLEQPFDAKKNLTRIFTEVAYYVAKEKVKDVASGLHNAIKNRMNNVWKMLAHPLNL